jgi:hypothetical protein
MDFNNLFSAFIGAFLGVATGFLGAFFIDWQRARRERRTHILALVREMLSNNIRVQLLLKESRREGGLEDGAWRELRVPLAGELPMELYNRIASRYDELPEVRHQYEAIAQGGGGNVPTDALQRWAERMMEENERLRAEVGERRDGLMRALRRRERRLAAQQGAARQPGEAGERS